MHLIKNYSEIVWKLVKQLAGYKHPVASWYQHLCYQSYVKCSHMLDKCSLDVSPILLAVALPLYCPLSIKPYSRLYINWISCRHRASLSRREMNWSKKLNCAPLNSEYNTWCMHFCFAFQLNRSDGLILEILILNKTLVISVDAVPYRRILEEPVSNLGTFKCFELFSQ